MKCRKTLQTNALFFSGEFGNGVLSYFLFLKSLFILNIIIFVIVFSFLSVPMIATSYDIFKTADQLNVSTTTAPVNVTTVTPSGNVSAIINLPSTPATNISRNGSFAKLSGTKTCVQPPAMKDRSKKSIADQIVDFITGQVQ